MTPYNSFFGGDEDIGKCIKIHLRVFNVSNSFHILSQNTNSVSEMSASNVMSDSPSSSNEASSAKPRLAEHMLYTADELETDRSPLIYRLRMREEMRRENSMIARQSIGRPHRKGRGENEKVFLVVGATGAGKSTLINGMVNYILGVEWKDDFRFKLITEDAQISQADSQTKDITAYTFHPMVGSAIHYTFTIIDTPGFGATEGLKRDKQITEQIKEFFSILPPEGIDHLDGIGFVTQASQARLTPTQEYIFDSILSIFGKDVSQNIFIMITFSDAQRPPVLEAIKKANIPSKSEKHFKFNNSALFAENNAEAELGELNFDEMFWKMGLGSFKKFFVEFPKSESVSLQLTKEVLHEREQLQVLLEGLNDQITLGLNKIEEMRQEEIVLQQREKEIKTNKDFTYEVEVIKRSYTDLKGTGRHTTTCVSCHNTCHKDCAFSDDMMKKLCFAMDKASGKCRICPRECIWSEHKNLPYLIEYKTFTETRTIEDLKQKYHKAVKEKATAEQMMNSLEESLQKVHNQVLTMIKQTQKTVRRLDEIALKPNPLTAVQYIEVLIESEKIGANPGWKQRVQYYEEAKRQAEVLSKVKDGEESQKLIQKLSLEGMDVNDEKETGKAQGKVSLDEEKSNKWYSRFKFW